MDEMNLMWNEVDGVATVCAGAEEIAGPLRAVLTFGSGFVDESLRNHGISHVVEHLALHGSDEQPALLFNGSAESMTTNFSVVGTPDQVADFFAFVTRRLADLPLDRLEDELRVLQVEARGRGSSPIGGDLEERFGPRSGGLLAWPELGLRTVDRYEVAAWSRERFTASNAVLWCSGPLPGRLSLAALPAGEPLARAQCPELRTPARAYVPLGRQQVGVSFVAQPSWSDGPAVEALRQLAFERLRAAALSYSVNSTMIRLAPDTRYWCITADGIDGNLDRVVQELIACVEEVTVDGPTEVAVDKLRAMWALGRSNPDRLVDFLDTAARRHLLGLEQYTLSELDEHTDAVTPESLRAGLEALAPTALAFGPQLGDGVPEGWTRHASWERGQVPGRRLEPITGREQGSLIAGSRGVTKRFDGHALSVRWQEIDACLVEGAALHLVDDAGTVVTVNPAHWRGGEYLAQLVREHVAPSQMIHLLRAVPAGRGAGAGRGPHAHWLATIAGVTAKRMPDIGSGTVSLVIDTDGVFVISEGDGDVDGAARSEVLRTAEREVLLAADARNRWIPQASLEAVELRGSVVPLGGSATHRLRVRTKTGSVLCFRLSTQKQADLARGALSAMLGRRFHEQSRRLPRVRA